MKTKYSRPYKNRLSRRTAPYHHKKAVFNVHLSKDLRSKHGVRALPVRKDDTVSILRGKFAGLSKRVTHVSFKKAKLQCEGIKTTKTDGTEIFHYVDPSNCLITSFGKLDEGRRAIIQRKVNSVATTTEEVLEEE